LHNNIFISAPASLEFLFTRSFYVEGTNVGVLCRNFNIRPGFRGSTVWTNQRGEVVGQATLSLIATRSRSGLYYCSVPTVPAIPIRNFNLVVNCKYSLVKLTSKV